jgi:hypothetical protein
VGHGEIEGLPERLADWLKRTKYDKSLPWVGLGIVADLEAVVRLLSLEEFGQWLRTHPDAELQRWGDEVLDAAGDRDALLATIDEHLPEGETATAAVELAGTAIVTAATELDAIRGVLIQCGALTAGDTETDVPALLRALLA